MTEDHCYREILNTITDLKGMPGYCPKSYADEHGGEEQFNRNYENALARVIKKGFVEFIEIDGNYRVTDKGMSVYLVMREIHKARITK